MNVYDFDKTIYSHDSTLEFYFFCLKKYPKILRLLPLQLNGLIKHIMGKISKEKFKETFFVFLTDLKDYKNDVKCFWEGKKLQSWYLKIQKKDDLVISASPLFLIKDFCKKNGIKNIIASNVNPLTGKFNSLNCYGEEKKVMFNKKYPNIKIKNFYSDSLSDEPLANKSINSYIVKKRKIINWKDYKDI